MLKKNLKTMGLALLALGFCASADAALVRTVRTEGLMALPGIPTREATAWCAPGEVASGGGYTSINGFNPRIDDSYPVSNGDLQGWKIRFTALVPYDPGMPFKMVGGLYVVCLKSE